MHDQLREPGQVAPRWRVIGAALINGCIKVFDLRENREVYLEHGRINDDVTNGALILDRPGAPRVSPVVQNDPKLTAALAVAGAQLAYVEQLRKGREISLHVAFKTAAAEGRLSTSRATLYRRARRKRNGLPLLSGNKNKGNRTERYSPELQGLVRSLVKSLYLKEGSRHTLRKTLETINDQAHATGLLTPNKKISGEYLRKILRMMTPDPDAARMNPKEVPAARSVGGDRIIATRPFERVEQDAVHLPFYIRVGDEVSNSVYLIHAIDAATSVPVGWNLSVVPPNESRGLKCIESILFSKRSAFERLGLSYEFDPCGTPDLVVMDNGPETRGDRFEKLGPIGIAVENLKARNPHKKPFIERLNRSLKEALETLGGCTRYNGVDGKRDPIALGDELMTLDELERWIVRWYYESWITVDLKRHVRADLHEDLKLGSTPKSRWLRMTVDLAYAIPMSPRRKDWEMCLYEWCEGKLNRKTGLPARGLRYSGRNLHYLIAKYGEETVPFLLDPDDYRHIRVFDGDEADWVILVEEHVTAKSLAHTFEDYKARCATAPVSKDSPEAVAYRMDVAKASAKSAGKKRSRKEQNADAVAKGKEQAARQRAIANPPLAQPALVPAPAPAPAPASKAGVAGQTQRSESSETMTRRFVLGQVQGNGILNRETGEEL